MDKSPDVTVVVEWSNALLAEADRPRRMMESLQRQSAELIHEEEAPIEVRICFDGEKVSPATIAAISPLAAPGRHESISVSLHDFPGADYYELKNLGSVGITTELILFLDSDVVPCNGWLESILATFAEPDRQVVGGISFIEQDSIYGKAMAVNWIFELEPGSKDVEPRGHFWANNVCFRRALFAEMPFRPIQGSSRGACARLAAEMERVGVTIWINEAARVTHPPPAGLSAFFERAMAQGRDRVLWHRCFGNTWLQSLPAGFFRYGKHLLQTIGRSVKNSRKVGVKPWEIPLVILVSGCYYSVFLLGELATHIMPDQMSRRFRI